MVVLMFLPISLKLHSKLCVIVGAGRIAAHKAEILLAHGARLRVVAPEFSEDALWQRELVEAIHAPYSAAHLADSLLVIAATNDRSVNAQVVADCNTRGILVQNTDTPAECDWALPAVIRRGAFTAAISTDGLLPSLSARIKKDLAPMFGDDLARICKDAVQVREIHKSHASDIQARNAALRELAQNLDEQWFLNHNDAATTNVGKVFLVGAGPGDPGLITAKGIACLRAATVVVHDALANKQLLDEYCNGALRIDVSKRKGRCKHMQPEINQILVDWAKRGHTVCRLKGGDPMIFGRGGEEARTLLAASIPFEIVPGVSSLSAVPAYAGIPITDREFGSASVGFFSLHRRNGDSLSEDEWQKIANGPETLVLFMGLSLLRTAIEKILHFGRPASEPIALISNGTLPQQRELISTLGEILSHPELETIPAPALIVIGSTIAARPSMQWFKPRPQAIPASIAKSNNDAPIELVLVRHAEVEEYAQKKYLGCTNAGLSALGLRQAAELRNADALQGCDMVFASPMLRVQQTLAQSQLKAPATIIDDLREVNFGSWELKTFADIADEDPVTLKQWSQLDGNFAFPGGDSIAEFHHRVAAAGQQILAQARTTSGVRKVAIFAHGVTLRMLISAWIGIPLHTLFSLDVGYASVTQIRISGNNGLLMNLNQTHHLHALNQESARS